MKAFVYKCPSCGANIQFNIEKQTFHCEYCENDYTLAQMQKIYADKHTLNKSETKKRLEKAEEYHCNQCGATIISDQSTVATFCLYCSNPSIIKEHIENVYLPDLIIPFQVSQQEAIKCYQKWVAKKFLAPKEFKSIKQQEKMRGLYLPYWLYDVESEFEFSGIGNKITTWRAGNYCYTKTDSFQIERIGNLKFLKIPADASSKMDDLTMKAIEPFDDQTLKTFDPSYFSGFFAEKYDEDKDKCFDKLQNELNNTTKNNVMKTIFGYVNTHFTKEKIKLNINKFSYAFFPVWILSYPYKGKIYQFTMNGQTKKLVGDVPIDKKKVLFLFLTLVVVLTILLFLGGMFSI